ncbi:GNAT family N-acetyltransferase [Microlunatus speluncae]|uniref:GNAT family N-acetyltransferase n=1 Tax=Microlunatus speluncae TaxID=2594267 RepID=UPI001375ACDA|nr:GNAT family N-acetyltransferase [Microlunatus speluncae]
MSTIDLDRLEFGRDDRSSRYEARLEGKLAAVVEYSMRDQTMIIVHTGTKPEFRGNGIAARITRHALDDVRSRGLRVVPECPFTAEFIAEHQDYADLVA